MRARFSSRLLSKLLSKRYRDAYVAENVRTGVAYQIRAMREQRNNMTQTQFGRLMGKAQSAVARLENPDYGKLTLQTLFEVAVAFDVALLVQFVTHAEFLRRTANVSPSSLEVASFNKAQLESLDSFSKNTLITINPSSFASVLSFDIDIENRASSVSAKTSLEGGVGHG